MSTQTFDQDNVFDEQQSSAFDAGAQPAAAGAKAVKKGGGSIPIWLWAVIALMVLLVTFVVFRIITGRRAAQSPAEIAPIVQTAQAPQPVIAPPAPEPMAQAAPQPDLTAGMAAPAPALPIPGEDPVAPPAPSVAASQPAASPVSAATAAPTAQPSADERKQLNDRIDALSGDVERLEKKLRDQQKQGGPAAAEKAAATPPAPITGLTLKAIVDESAWLQTESGETVMVQPGDVIHGVGTVKAVDPDAGAVRLTDGRVLR